MGWLSERWKDIKESSVKDIIAAVVVIGAAIIAGPAVLAAIGSAGAVGTAVTNLAINLAVGYVAAKLFGPDVPGAEPDPGVLTRANASTSNKIPVVYGEQRIRGTTYMADISADSQRIAFLVALSEGPIEDIGTVRWRDNVLTLGSDGFVTNAVDGMGVTDDFLNGNLKIVKYPDGGRCSEMEAFSTQWANNAANRTMPNLAYVYIELVYNREKGVTGLTPDLSFDIKGKKIRTLSKSGDNPAVLSATETYSQSPAETLIDFMTDPVYGCGDLFEDSTFDLDSLYSWKTFCETSLPYTDSNGVAQNAPRYRSNGFVATTGPRQQPLADITASASGLLTYNQGKFGIIVERPADSVMSFDEDNIYGTISISDQGFGSQLNKVVIKYSESQNDYQQDQVYIETPASAQNPNEPELSNDITIPFINTNIEAQRLGTIILNESRNSQTISFKTDMRVLELEPGDVISVSNKAFGITDKEYRILTISDGSIYGGVESYSVVAKEYSDTVYTDITPVEVDATPNTNFPAPWRIGFVAAPTFSLINETGLIPSFNINWVVPDNSLISYFLIYASPNGGTSYEVIKRVELTNTSYVAGETVSEIITDLEGGTYIFIILGGNTYSKQVAGFESASLVWTPTRSPVLLTGTGDGDVPANVPDPEVNWQLFDGDIINTTYDDGTTIQKYDSSTDTWTTLTEYFDGNLVYDGTITANKVKAKEIFADQSLSVNIADIQDAIQWIDGDDAPDATQGTPSIDPAWTGAGAYLGLVDNDVSGSTITDVSTLLVGNVTDNMFFNGTNLVLSGVTIDGASLINTPVDSTLTIEDNGTEISDMVTTINAGQGISVTGTGSTLTLSADTQVGTGTDLAVGTRTSTTMIIESSTGMNVTVPQSSITQAGLLTSTQHVKLAGIESGATGDQTDAEIIAAAETNTNIKALTDAVSPVFTDTQLTDAEVITAAETNANIAALTAATNPVFTDTQLTDAEVVTAAGSNDNLEALIDFVGTPVFTDTAGVTQTQAVWNTGTSTVESIISPAKFAAAVAVHENDTTYAISATDPNGLDTAAITLTGNDSSTDSVSLDGSEGITTAVTDSSNIDISITDGGVTADKLGDSVVNLEKIAVQQMQNLVFDVSYADGADSSPETAGEIFSAADAGVNRAASGPWSNITFLRVNIRDSNNIFIGNVIDLFVVETSYLKTAQSETDFATYKIKFIDETNIVGTGDSRTGYYIFNISDAPLQNTGSYTQDTDMTVSLQIKTDQVVDGKLIVTGSIEADSLDVNNATVGKLFATTAEIGEISTNFLDAAVIVADFISAGSITGDQINANTVIARTIRSDNYVAPTLPLNPPNRGYSAEHVEGIIFAEEVRANLTGFVTAPSQTPSEGTYTYNGSAITAEYLDVSVGDVWDDFNVIVDGVTQTFKGKLSEPVYELTLPTNPEDNIFASGNWQGGIIIAPDAEYEWYSFLTENTISGAFQSQYLIVPVWVSYDANDNILGEVNYLTAGDNIFINSIGSRDAVGSSRTINLIAQPDTVNEIGDFSSILIGAQLAAFVPVTARLHFRVISEYTQQHTLAVVRPGDTSTIAFTAGILANSAISFSVKSNDGTMNTDTITQLNT